MNVRNLTVPTLIGLSLLFGACAEQQIEAPDTGTVEESIEGLEESAEDATGTIQDGVKNLQKDATGAVTEGIDGVKQGTEDATGAATDAIEELGEQIPGTSNEQN